MVKMTSKEVIRRNLQALMERDGLSGKSLEKKSKTAQKTVWKILNGKSAPTLDTVDKLAAAFGVTAWHLIMPNLPNELLSDRKIEQVVSLYVQTEEKGREYIHHVAEREAKYGK